VPGVPELKAVFPAEVDDAFEGRAEGIIHQNLPALLVFVQMEIAAEGIRQKEHRKAHGSAHCRNLAGGSQRGSGANGGRPS